MYPSPRPHIAIHASSALIRMQERLDALGRQLGRHAPSSATGAAREIALAAHRLQILVQFASSAPPEDWDQFCHTVRDADASLTLFLDQPPEWRSSLPELPGLQNWLTGPARPDWQIVWISDPAGWTRTLARERCSHLIAGSASPFRQAAFPHGIRRMIVSPDRPPAGFGHSRTWTGIGQQIFSSLRTGPETPTAPD